MKIITNLHKKLKIGRQITHGCYVLLLLVLTANSLVKSQPVIILVFTLVPLLIFIPGLIKENYKSISLLCFITLPYFIVAVNHLFAPNYHWLDLLELIIVVVLFHSTMMFSRWKQYSLYQEYEPEKIETSTEESA